jgi:hypothetical protein
VSRPVMMLVLAALELVALAYFVLVIWRAEALAAVLLRRGYAERGWTEARLAFRLRLLGVVGAVLALIAVVVAVAKVFA